MACTDPDFSNYLWFMWGMLGLMCFQLLWLLVHSGLFVFFTRCCSPEQLEEKKFGDLTQDYQKAYIAEAARRAFKSTCRQIVAYMLFVGYFVFYNYKDFYNFWYNGNCDIAYQWDKVSVDASVQILYGLAFLPWIWPCLDWFWHAKYFAGTPQQGRTDAPKPWRSPWWYMKWFEIIILLGTFADCAINIGINWWNPNNTYLTNSVYVHFMPAVLGAAIFVNVGAIDRFAFRDFDTKANNIIFLSDASENAKATTRLLPDVEIKVDKAETQPQASHGFLVRHYFPTCKKWASGLFAIVRWLCIGALVAFWQIDIENPPSGDPYVLNSKEQYGYLFVVVLFYVIQVCTAILTRLNLSSCETVACDIKPDKDYKRFSLEGMQFGMTCIM
jgi:hypothetical protein